MYALLAALLACTCAAPPAATPQERAWTARDPRQIVARFAGQSDVALAPEQAFRARGRCASITRAVVTPLPAGAAGPNRGSPATPTFAGLRVEVEGVGLERVTRIAAYLPAGERGPAGHAPGEALRSTPPRLAPSGALSGERGEDAPAEGGAAPGAASTGPRPRRSASNADREGGPQPPPPHESQRSSTPESPTPGALADIKVVRSGEKLVFPVFCATCEVVLGVPLDATPDAPTVGCVGPGWSLRFRDGTLAGD